MVFRLCWCSRTFHWWADLLWLYIGVRQWRCFNSFNDNINLKQSSYFYPMIRGVALCEILLPWATLSNLFIFEKQNSFRASSVWMISWKKSNSHQGWKEDLLDGANMYIITSFFLVLFIDFLPNDYNNDDWDICTPVVMKSASNLLPLPIL